MRRAWLSHARRRHSGGDSEMKIVGGSLAVTALALVVTTSPLHARISSAAILHMLDTDDDATVDSAEAKKAAITLFDRLDTDNDGTLDANELSGRLTEDEIVAGSAHHNKTLTKDEYLSIVDERFKAADSNHDGKLDIQELSSLGGDAVVKLLVLRIVV
jgi:EF hand domain-containing protein